MMFLPLMELPEALTTSGLGFVLVLAVLAGLAIFVWLLSKGFGEKKKKAKDAPAETSTPETQQTAEAAPVIESKEEKAVEEPVIPHIPGYVVLDGVSEQDAAVVMAITSHKTGIDLSHLDFKSIKRLNQNPVLENIEEQDAAAIMAITADKTGIPLENLIFNSIKLVK